MRIIRNSQANERSGSLCKGVASPAEARGEEAGSESRVHGERVGLAGGREVEESGSSSRCWWNDCGASSRFSTRAGISRVHKCPTGFRQVANVGSGRYPLLRHQSTVSGSCSLPTLWTVAAGRNSSRGSQKAPTRQARQQLGLTSQAESPFASKSSMRMVRCWQYCFCDLDPTN